MHEQELKTSYQRYPKPPYSYAGMIALAIVNSPEGRLTLSQIHQALAGMFMFFKDTNYVGWKDSVRHNLSQNPCFRKILKNPRRVNAKGNYWVVDLTRISPDIFVRQETEVARTGNWAEQLHVQVGLNPVILNSHRDSPKEISFDLDTFPLSATNFPRTSTPVDATKKRNIKRKADFDAQEMIRTVQEPKAKRQKPFSFSIASILRLRSHIEEKITKARATKSKPVQHLATDLPIDDYLSDLSCQRETPAAFANIPQASTQHLYATHGINGAISTTTDDTHRPSLHSGQHYSQDLSCFVPPCQIPGETQNRSPNFGHFGQFGRIEKTTNFSAYPYPQTNAFFPNHHTDFVLF